MVEGRGWACPGNGVWAWWHGHQMALTAFSLGLCPWKSCHYYSGRINRSVKVSQVFWLISCTIMVQSLWHLGQLHFFFPGAPETLLGGSMLEVAGTQATLPPTLPKAIFLHVCALETLSKKILSHLTFLCWGEIQLFQKRSWEHWKCL